MKTKRTVSAVGVDVHYKFSRAALVDATGKVVRRERLDHRDRRRLREQVSTWPRGVTVVLEGSFGWPWLSDLMVEVGLDVRLANCWKVDKMREARGQAKTNDKDAGGLALLPLEATEWWRTWLAPPSVRNLREFTRHRADLVAMQTQIKNRIHAVFHRHGIFHDFSDLFGSGGRAFLAALVNEEAPQSVLLPRESLDALRSNLFLLLQLRQELAVIAGQLRGRLAQSPELRRIKSVPGFGLVLSHVVWSEIGCLSRFGKSRALASYAGLAPQSRDSGEPDTFAAPKGRRLPRRANRTLKWAFIEAAHGAVRHGGRWRSLYDRHTQGGRKNCGQGYIRVARELVEVVYAVLRDKRLYEERASATSARSARPGMGRPQHPMVAVHE